MWHRAGHCKAAGDCSPCDRHVRSGAESPQDSVRPFENAHISSGDSRSEQKLGTCSVNITYILKKYVSQAELDSDTRKISPHVLRHTKAMHLLRAGVNMIYIRDFLGHVDISTTEVYARTDAEMKRKVFEEKVPNFTPNTTMPWEEDKDLLQWLTKFGKKSF